MSSLKEAATSAIHTYNQSVHTEISAEPANGSANANESSMLEVDGEATESADSRKQSIVSISTTISQSISPQPTPMIEGDGDMYNTADILEQLGTTPFLRALLLIAEMSSAGNMLNEAYAQRSVEIAREHKDFVMGFIAQRSLNSEPEDNFLTMTPGVKLPPPGQSGAVLGDGKGQQYNSPRHIIYDKGCDVAIVGRGIVQAENRAEEAERYRKEAWAAYEDRIAK